MNSAVTTLDIFKQNMHIIDLAFDYLSIDPSEKEKVTKLLEEKSQEKSDINVTDIFKQEKLISEEEIDCLFIFDAHLQTLCRDHQFGKLVIANGLATKADLDKALKHQQSYFKKYRINIKIGDVLVENKTMTNADRVSILLTQNRIKDENLLEALNDIGASQIQKEAINKRFGVLAIKKELVSIAQVNAALEVQKEEINARKKPRFIGQILQEIAKLSDGDLLQILLEQKQFEKRTLNLENALYTIKSEIKISKRLNKLFEYNFSKDGVEAYVNKIAETDEAVPIFEFLIWLRKAGIKFGIVKDSVLEEFIQNAKKGSPILVAKGSPIKKCIDESIQFYFKNESIPVQDNLNQADSDSSEPEKPEQEKLEPEKPEPLEKNDSAEKEETDDKQPQESEVESEKEETKEPDESEPDPDEENEENKPDEENEVNKPDEDEASKKEAKLEETTASKENGDAKENTGEEKTDNDETLFVKKGTLLARIISGKKGKPGKDVLGYPVQPGNPSTCVLSAQSGVVKKGDVFFATIAGCPILKNGTILMVEPVVEKSEIKTIVGSIRNDTEKMYESATVEIRGTITSEATLRCHSLLLQGDLMGNVICTGDIDVKGMIGTDKKPKDKESAQQVQIICQGSISVSKSITNSNIQTAGELLALNSTVVGSDLMAFNSITIGNAVKGEHTPSTLHFGLKPGDKTPSIDFTIETKKAELSILRKESDIADLTEEYKKEKQEEENHLIEQDILNNFIEIIQAPELYQHESVEDKIKYLYLLPDFSSIKAFYLRFPETDTALAFRNKIMTSIGKMTLDKVVEHIKKQLDPEPDPEENQEKDEDAISKADQIETQFKARLAAFEKEIEDKSEEIEKIENEIKELKALRLKLGAKHINSLAQSKAVIKIKNKCEKGTIVKGKIAQLVLEKSVYNVKFKEVMNPKTEIVSIIIETY